MLWNHSLLGRIVFSLVLCVLCSALPAMAEQQTATWLDPLSGNWTDSAKWSAVAYPNNGAATTYAVVIDADGAPYAVTLAQNATVDSLLVDSGDVDLGLQDCKLTIENGLTIRETNQIHAKHSGMLLKSGQSLIEGSEVIFDSTGYITVLAEASLMIGTGTTIRTGSYYGHVTNCGATGNLVNYGTLSAQNGQWLEVSNVTNLGLLEARGAKSLLVGSDLSGNLGRTAIVDAAKLDLSGDFVIDQPINVSQGQTLALGGTFSNTGGINILDGTLALSGTFANGQVGPLTLDNARVEFASSYSPSEMTLLADEDSTFRIVSGGVVANTGQTLALDPSMGDWGLDGGKIVGGTVTTSGGAELTMTGVNNLLEGVTLDASVVGYGAQPNMRELTLDSVVNSGSVTVTNTELVLKGVWSNPGTIHASHSYTYLLSMPSEIGDITVEDGIMFVGPYHYDDFYQPVLTVTTAQIEQINVTDGGLLGLTSKAVLDNTGDVLMVSSSQPLGLFGCTIVGGTIDSLDGSPLELKPYHTDPADVGLSMTISSSCVLDGVTLATDFLVDRPAYEFSIYSLTLRNGLTLENGSAVVVGGDYRNRVFAEGDMEISGQGQVQLPGRATSSQSNSWPLIVLKHSELTIGEDVEVILNGGYGIIRPDYENDSGLINNGIISGRGAGEFTLAVTSAMENHGLIQATEGTELSISAQGSSMLNSGTIEALQDSNLYIYGWGQPLLNNGSFHVDASSYIRVYDGFEPTDESLIWIELLSEGASGKLFLDGDCVLAGGLKLRFAEGFDLEVGQTFNVIISSGSISGEFDSVDTSLLPAGLSASVHYGSQAVTVEIVSEPESIPGDYNADGTVDLADYTVWADSYGQTGSDLPADGNEDGVVDLADYTVWADHFGQTTN